MAKKITTARKTKRILKQPTDQNVNYEKMVSTTLKEKYQYFLIGFTVLLMIIIGTSYALMKKTEKKIARIDKGISTSIAPKVTPTMTATISATIQTPKVDPTAAAKAANVKPSKEVKKYTVQQGEGLWQIAEKAYGSGFNYVDIVKYNHLIDENDIEPGQVLLLPPVAPQLPTDPTVLEKGGQGGAEPQGELPAFAAMTEEITVKTNTYKVVKGDTLWSISVKTLGDGFAWTDIAKANHISDPANLEKDTILQIPR